MTTQTPLLASVNEASFMKNMRTLFAGTNSFIGELMQNARRAGASKIKFTTDGANLTCEDDGSGILDFSKLLTFCESNWDESVMKSDTPFGMGVFSYFFAAEQVIFESLGKRVTIVCTDLLNGAPADSQDIAITTGTKIIFIGVKNKLNFRTLSTMARGFPIPVSLDEKEVVRDHALNETFISTKVGQANINLSDNWTACYLQGLPVGLDAHNGYANNAIHLENNQFEAQMPDRAMLYNHDAAMTSVNDVVRQERIRQLVSKMEELSPAKFLSEYGSLVDTLGVMHLLNNFPLFNHKHARPVTADLIEDKYIFDPMGKKDIECALLVKGLPEQYEEHKALLIHCLGLEHTVLDVIASAEHWLAKVAFDYDDLVVEVLKGEDLKSDDVWGTDVTLVSELSIKVSGPNGFERIYPMKHFVLDVHKDVAPDEEIDPEGDVFVLSVKDSLMTPHTCLKNFRDENERLDDAEESSEQESWHAVLQRLNGTADFCTNIAEAVAKNGVIAQEVGDMAVFMAAEKITAPNAAKMDDAWFSRVAELAGCQPGKLKEAIKAAFDNV